MKQFRNLLIAAALGQGLLPGASAALAAPLDLEGVWRPIDPPKALLTTDGKAPPLLPPARAVYERRKAQLAKGDLSFDRSSTRCGPEGEPRILTEDAPFDIFQTPQKLLFGFERSRLLRYIDLDKPMDVISPYYFGTSVGHISGDRLEVEVQGFNDRFFLDRSGMPHSDALSLKETFSLEPGGEVMRVRIRFEDPKTFSRPWETVLRFRKLKAVRIAEDVCPIRENLVPKDMQFFDPQ